LGALENREKHRPYPPARSREREKRGPPWPWYALAREKHRPYPPARSLEREKRGPPWLWCARSREKRFLYPFGRTPDREMRPSLWRWRGSADKNPGLRPLRTQIGDEAAGDDRPHAVTRTITEPGICFSRSHARDDPCEFEDGVELLPVACCCWLPAGAG
jgi:hypothetical protein